MDFDYRDKTGVLQGILERRISGLIADISGYRDEYGDVNENQVLSDIFSEIGYTLGEIDDLISGEIADDICYQMNDFNLQSDEYLIEAIKVDKKVFNYIIDPSEDVINVYKFIYEL